MQLCKPHALHPSAASMLTGSACCSHNLLPIVDSAAILPPFVPSQGLRSAERAEGLTASTGADKLVSRCPSLLLRLIPTFQKQPQVQMAGGSRRSCSIISLISSSRNAGSEIPNLVQTSPAADQLS